MSELALLQTLCRADLAVVDRVLQEQMASQALLIPQLSKHLVDAGGKRIRPLLLIGAAKYCGLNDSAIAAKMAAAVEFIHTATLLHDDVVDESAQRRGQATANTLWGNKASVLVGDFLFSRSFQLMVESKSLDVLETLSKASAVIAEGEVLQLAVTGNLQTPIDGYLNVVTAKTAALFQASCEVGAILADNQSERQNLKEFGKQLGIIFQIRDDVRDFTAVPGKQVGNDFFERKVTAPIIYAFEKGDVGQQDFWQRTIGKGKFQDGDFEVAQRFITEHNAIERCRNLAQHYFKIGRGLIKDPSSEAGQALLQALENANNF